jgi:hypothetical protein
VDDVFVTIEVPTVVKVVRNPGLSQSEDEPFVLIEDVWNDVCPYLAMLENKLPELQEGIAKSKLAMTEIVMGVEDKVGDVVAELGSGTEVPGGPYLNLWSGIGTAL